MSSNNNYFERIGIFFANMFGSPDRRTVEMINADNAQL